MFIDYSGVYYEIQARQYDGLTGQPSPVVRRDRTRDREFVAKAAALMIEQDFGLLGEFDAWPAKGDNNEDKPVALELKGSALGVPLDRWIEKGDVFAVVQMPHGDSSAGRLVPNALLLVDAAPSPGDASCRCRVFRRYDAPRDADGDGYRCIKLGTVKAPLRLRLLQALPNGGSGPLKDSLTVQIRHSGFNDEDQKKIDTSTGDADDSVDTSADNNGVFDHVAFVSVFSVGDVPRARIPVPLLNDQPVTIAINVADDADSLLQFRKADWERHVDAAWQVQNQLFKEINDLSAKPDKRRGDEKDRRSASAKPRRLRPAEQGARRAGQGGRPTQRAVYSGSSGEDPGGRDRVARVSGQDEEDRCGGKRSAKEGMAAQVEQGKRLESEDVEKAIALYADLLKTDAPDEALKDELAKHLADLREKEPKTAEHRNARAFIYNVWPNLDDAGLKEKLQEARDAYVACKTAGDMASLRKLLQATVAHAVRMKQELDQLRPDVNVDDEKPAKLIKEVSEGLGKLARDVKETLDANVGK